MALAAARVTLRPLAVPLATEVALVGADLDFDPRDLAGLVLWLQNKMALTDGTAVTAWPDRSGLENHATQSSASPRPLYRLGVINGRSVVRFDGVDDVLNANRLAALVSGSDVPCTVFLVAKNTSIGDNTLWCFGRSLSSSPLFELQNGDAVNRRDDTNVLVVVAGSTAMSSFSVKTVNFHGTTIDIMHNGVALRGALDVGPLTLDTFTLGARSVGGIVSNYAITDIAELIAYNRDLPASEQKRVERYLGRNYRIAVS